MNYGDFHPSEQESTPSQGYGLEDLSLDEIGGFVASLDLDTVDVEALDFAIAELPGRDFEKGHRLYSDLIASDDVGKRFIAAVHIDRLLRPVQQRDTLSRAQAIGWWVALLLDDDEAVGEQARRLLHDTIAYGTLERGAIAHLTADIVIQMQDLKHDQ